MRSMEKRMNDAIQEATNAVNDIMRVEWERNHWRNEHDRVVREYQHRLMVLGTSVIEASTYPENTNRNENKK